MHKICVLMFLSLLVSLLVAACAKAETPAPARPVVSEPAPTADDRPIILAFGDSLTAGSGVPPGSGYPELLQMELDTRGYHYRVVNAGIGGDTTSGGLGRLPNALRMKPEVVLLELGGNDGLRGVPAETIRSNIEELSVAFKKAGARVVLAGMTLPRNLGNEYISAFEKVYTATAKEHGLTLIPFLLEGAAGDPDLMLEDGIHPNAAGYRIVTTNVLKYVEPLLKR